MERKAQAEALEKLEKAAEKSKNETEGDSFEVAGPEVLSDESDVVESASSDDDDDVDFGDFDDSNETDFFNGRMSQQYEVDPEIYDAKKKSSKTTIILVAILVVVVAVIVGIVVI